MYEICDLCYLAVEHLEMVILFEFHVWRRVSFSLRVDNESVKLGLSSFLENSRHS